MTQSANDIPVVPLTAAERERKGPTLRPKDAATMIVVDRSAKAPKVLMGRRHPNLKFMPGKFVFPGGRIEVSDRRMAAAGALDAICEERLMRRVQRPTASRARALALSAIRETFEETGLMFGQAGLGVPSAPAGSTWEHFAAESVFPDLEALTLIARAITPPGRPRRFDTRFFVVDAGAAATRIEGVIGPESELVELVSVTFTEALSLDLPTITKRVLADLEERIANGFGRHLPVPFYYEARGAYRRDLL